MESLAILPDEGFVFTTICPFCQKSNQLNPPIEIPARCVSCFKAFEPACPDCRKLFHACQCDGKTFSRKTTPVSVRIKGTSPPETIKASSDDGWRTPPEQLEIRPPKRADTEPIARTRTITNDKPYIALDSTDNEALNRLRDCRDYPDPLDYDRDRLLVYLVETICRIENMLAAAPPDVLEDIRETRTLQRKQ